MSVEPERLALLEAMREDELDAAALYRALADASNGRRRDVLNRLAEAGGTDNRNIILLAGLVGLLAGAFSMAAGEWVSVQSQREVYEREISVEREELAEFPEEELEELILIYQAKGLSDDEAKALARRTMWRPEGALGA